MTKIQASKARGSFAEVIDRVRMGGERIMLRRYGRDVAAIVPPEDAERLERIEDRYWLSEARKAKREGRRVPWAKVKRELGL